MPDRDCVRLRGNARQPLEPDPVETGGGIEILLKQQTVFTAIRCRVPRIHCITNHAASVLTANGLLASGATPSLTANPDEVADFVSSADALLVNCGTLDDERKRAIPVALEAARVKAIPVVLDPVFCERSAARLRFASELVLSGPAVIKMNPAEAEALFPGKLSDPVALSRETGAVIVVTGSQNLIASPAGVRTVEGGSPFMAQTTAMGCLLGALIAAAIAVSSDSDEGIAGAVEAFCTAGRNAGQKAGGAGTFVPLLLDEIHGMSANGDA